MDLEYLIAAAKGIKDLRLYDDKALIERVFQLIPPDLLDSVNATVLETDIDSSYKKSTAALYQAIKSALASRKQAETEVNRCVDKATQLEL